MEFIISASDPAVALTVGDKFDFVVARDFIATDVLAKTKIAQVGGSPILVQLTCDGGDALASPVGIEGATQPAFANPLFPQFSRMGVRVVQIGDGTAKGLDLVVAGYEPLRIFTPSPPPPGSPTEQIINRTTIMPFGNAIQAFPASNAFDGVTNKTAGTCAGISSTPLFIGGAFTVGKKFSRFKISGPNDRGYISGANPAVSIKLFLKNGAISGPTDAGASVAEINFTDLTDERIERELLVPSPFKDTAYDHFALYINGGALSTYAAQITGYELV
jgi:hypothetical protein